MTAKTVLNYFLKIINIKLIIFFLLTQIDGLYFFILLIFVNKS